MCQPEEEKPGPHAPARKKLEGMLANKVNKVLQVLGSDMSQGTRSKGERNNGEGSLAEEHKLRLKSWVGGCKLRSMKKPAGREVDEHKWGKGDRETDPLGLLKKRSLSFHSREGRNMVESAFSENEVRARLEEGT